MIIDFRFRPNTPEFLSIAENRVFKGMMQWLGFQSKSVPLEEQVRDLNQAEVDMVVIQGRDLESTFGWMVPNDHVAQLVRRYPRKFIGFAGVDPHKGIQAVRELQRAVVDLGLKGASIDPYMQKLPANDKKYYPIYSKCVELGVPIILTTGPGVNVPDSVIEHVSPMNIDEVAKDFPDLTLIMSHGGYPWVTETIVLAMRHRNVYFEFSAYEMMPGSNQYVQAANTIITDKILYASAHPFVEFRESLKVYQTLPFTVEAREKVMGRNAARILGLAV